MSLFCNLSMPAVGLIQIFLLQSMAVCENLSHRLPGYPGREWRSVPPPWRPFQLLSFLREVVLPYVKDILP